MSLAAFHQAILDDPDDDAPRLIYADLIEEQGQPERAEFIRVQVAKEHHAPTDPARAALERRENQLLAAHRVEWVAAMPALPGINWSRFRRGFPDYVDVNYQIDAPGADRLIASMPALVETAPLQALWFRGLDRAGAARLGASDQFLGITQLNLTGLSVEVAAAWALIRSGAFANVGDFTLFGRAQESDYRQLDGLEFVDRVESLALMSSQMRDQGLALLLKAGRWRSLRRLDLRSAGLHAPFAMLRRNPLVDQLEAIDLRENAFEDREWDGLRSLFGDRARFGTR